MINHDFEKKKKPSETTSPEFGQEQEQQVQLSRNYTDEKAL